MKFTTGFVFCFVAMCQFAAAGEPVKVTVIAKGVHCERCVTAIGAALSKVEGIKFDMDQINRGEKPRWFSEPFSITIEDSKKTTIGSLGKAVAAADTPHKDDLPPSLNLILFTPVDITEETVMALRSELMKINGVEVVAPGSLGGFPKKLYYWVCLHKDGNAKLDEIITAAKSAATVSLEKQ